MNRHSVHLSFPECCDIYILFLHKYYLSALEIYKMILRRLFTGKNCSPTAILSGMLRSNETARR